MLIVEDDADWLRGLSSFLSDEPDIVVTAQASSPEDALEAFKQHPFDIVLMDIMLAGEAEGIWLASEVSRSSKAKVIMLTSMQEKDLIFGAFQAGATNYLVKSNFEAIPGAIREAYRNQASINSSVAEQMREEFRRLRQMEMRYQAKELKDKITPSEMQVLEMIDKGMTQTDIASKLVVSIRTIKNHVGNILRKMGGGSSKEAARKARDMGLFEEKE